MKKRDEYEARGKKTTKTPAGIKKREEIDIERGDGSRGTIVVNSAPIRDPDGSVAAACPSPTSARARC